MKIVEYQIQEYSDVDDLVDAVNKYIEDGWQPFGSPYVIGYRDYEWHYQAMVKYE